MLALRRQLHVLERSRRPRLRLSVADRLLWVWLSRISPSGGRRSSSCNRRPSSRGTGVGFAWSGRGMHSRTHLGLNKDSPTSRLVMPPSTGRIVAVSEVNGLHHRYNRAAA